MSRLSRRRVANLLACAALVILPAATPAADTAPATSPTTRPKITVDKSTTLLTSPLRDDGTVDYVKGLDEILSKGVARENNLFVALLQISGTTGNQLSPKIKPYVLDRYKLPDTDDTWTSYKVENRADSNKELDTLDSLYKAPWKKEDHPHVAAWLAENEDAFAHIADAAKLDHYAIPVWDGDEGRLVNVLLPSLGRYREYANALSSRATLRRGSGDFAGCAQDLLSAHRLGRLVSQGGTLIEKLVAVGIETRAAMTDITLATSGKLSAKDAAAYLAQLDKLPELRPTWEAADLFERCALLDETTRIARFGRRSLLGLAGMVDEKTRFPFTDKQLAAMDYNAVLKVINQEYDGLVAAMKLEDPAARAAAAAKFDARIKDDKVAWEDEFAEGKDLNAALAHCLIAIDMPAVGAAGEIDQTARVRTDQAHVALALAAYHADHKTYPDTLDALITEKYLSKLPPDRYSPAASQPFRYIRDADNYTLYSLGRNLKDDGGKPGRGMEGDLVITGKGGG